jgi:hypothetical protein
VLSNHIACSRGGSQPDGAFEDGSNGVEAGVFEMLERMLTGRWKLFSNASARLEEFRCITARQDGS